MPYYAAHRDEPQPAGCDLRLYKRWEDVRDEAAREVSVADATMVTSYCPDALAASELVFDAHTLRVFYDLDTPVTLSALSRGEHVSYLPPGGLARFDLVLSFTGGPALDELKQKLGARCTVPLYGCVDTERHRPDGHAEPFRCELSYLGTYAVDRRPAFEQLLLAPARVRPSARFVVAGPLYPDSATWPLNVKYVPYLDQKEHSAFYGSSRITLSLVRAAMGALGHCPSARLFEAAACGTPLVSDIWPGIDAFFTPGSEIFLARSTDDVIAALDQPDDRLRAVADAARARVLSEHTGERRAAELVEMLERGPRRSTRARSSQKPSCQSPRAHVDESKAELEPKEGLYVGNHSGRGTR